MACLKWKSVLERKRNPPKEKCVEEVARLEDQYTESDKSQQRNLEGSGVGDLMEDKSILIFRERINVVTDLDPFVLYHEAWAMILRCDQKYYPVGKRTSQDISTTQSGVKVLKDRMDSERALELLGGNLLPVLDKNSPLLQLKISIAHIRTEREYANPIKFWVGIHADQVSTKVNLKTGDTGVKCIQVDDVL